MIKLLKAAALMMVCAGISCRASVLPVGSNSATVTDFLLSSLAVEHTSKPPVTEPATATFVIPSLPPSTLIPTAAMQSPAKPASLTPPALNPLPSTTSGPSPTFPPVAQDTWCIPWNAPARQASVLRVIDGTTIEVNLDGKTQQITYSGLGLFDYSGDWRIWEQMTQANRQMVEGKTVNLIGGGPGSHMGEAQLRYVLVENKFVNLELIKSGYSSAQSTPPETSCDEVFRQAQAEAAARLRGLSALTPTPTRTQRLAVVTASTTGTLIIVKIASIGTPWQEPEEFVEIMNIGTHPVQLAGWSIRDAESHAFIFPDFVLGAGQYCRVTTNEYQPEHCGFSYYRPSPVWDNDGDCAYLQDSQGRLIDEYCY